MSKVSKKCVGKKNGSRLFRENMKRASQQVEISEQGQLTRLLAFVHVSRAAYYLSGFWNNITEHNIFGDIIHFFGNLI